MLSRSRWSVVLLAAACAWGESRPVDAPDGEKAREVVPVSRDVTDPRVRPTLPAYRPGAVAGGGSVTGTVTVVVPDAPAPVSADACGARRRGRRGAPAADSTSGAVVWLEGVAAGKPMPTLRRYELALDGCRLTPSALAAVAGGTLNVHGVDAPDGPAAAERLVFARGGGGAGAGTVLLRTPLSARGQVVPSEGVLAEPGLVEVRGEAARGAADSVAAAAAGLRAWVLAFDQPYFAAVGAGGGFTLAEVPAGRYTLVAWHPRVGRVEQAVVVELGRGTTVSLTLGVKGAAGGAVAGGATGGP